LPDYHPQPIFALPYTQSISILPNKTFPKIQFWKVTLDLEGKNGGFAVFSSVFPKTNQILGNIQIYHVLL
jgi:hypothetical protein